MVLLLTTCLNRKAYYRSASIKCITPIPHPPSPIPRPPSPPPHTRAKTAVSSSPQFLPGYKKRTGLKNRVSAFLIPATTRVTARWPVHACSAGPRPCWGSTGSWRRQPGRRRRCTTYRGFGSARPICSTDSEMGGEREGSESKGGG